MGKASSAKRNRVASPARSKPGSGSPLPWITAVVLIAIAGIAIIIFSRGKEDVHPVANLDHWHAAIGVKVCGTWLPNPGEFHVLHENQNINAGIHSHGDGLIHIHPYSSSEGGDNATVGRFFDSGGWHVDADSINLVDGYQWSENTNYQNGDECSNGKPGRIVWSVNGERREGNPADYKPQQGDVIAIGFLTEGQKLGTPPSAANLQAPIDVTGSTPTAQIPTTTAPTATTTGSSTTTAGSEPSSSAPPTQTTG
jgi:hypothetical protein